MKQWYEEDTLLFDMEKAEMGQRFPEARLEQLSDGRYYWILEFPLIVSPVSPPDCVRKWKIMMVYDSDFTPFVKQRKGYTRTIRIYPLSPNMKDMEEMYRIHKGCYPPHILVDEFANKYLCVDYDNGKSDRVARAADVAADTIKWLTAFELSLIYNDIFEKFKINDTASSSRE